MPLLWGIAGASNIAHDFCISLSSKLTSVEHKVVAIASRSKKSAEVFSREHLIDRSYGSYKELAKDIDVEVVYVSVINHQHFDVCKIMIEHGKHVVCEKPFCLNSRQVKSLFLLARSKDVFIMEGLWSRFFPTYKHLSKLIDIQSLGEIKEIYIKHGFNGSKEERIIKRDLGGGIVLDIGCYAIQFVLFVFREAPKVVKASGKINSDGVDLYFEADLLFSQERTARIICSGLEELENQATVISTKGPICIPMYWCPTCLVTSDYVRNWPLMDVQSALNFKNTIGLKYEADEVKNCIRSGKLQCDLITHSDTLLIAQIQDEIRKQIGVRYQCDK